MRGVTLEFRRGEVVGLIGPNGAGKSTLVNIVSGFDRPDRGRWLSARRRHALVAAPARTARPGPHVPTQPLVRLALGARERRGRRARCRREPEARNAARRLAAGGTRAPAVRRRGGVVARSRRRAPARSCPRGRDRTDLRLARRAGRRASRSRGPRFAAVVRSVRDQHGAGVLLIDHNMALIMEICDRIHVLDQGTTLAEGAPAEIRSNLDVAAAYLGERAVTRNQHAHPRGARCSLRRRPGRARSVVRSRPGRDRRTDRRERRRQILDAARDHGRRAYRRRRRAPRR